jgi:putative ABC transport system permease protein
VIANYFKIGLRILNRQRSYTLLNIIGLAIGIAVFVFIYLYVQSEIRYDRHWADSDRIYRVWNEYALDGKAETVAITPYRLSGELADNFEGVEEATMLFFTDPSDVNDMSSLTFEEEVFEIPDITLSDENLFTIFDYEFIEGEPETALAEPNTMVITDEVAFQIFGNEPALGKKLSTIIREYTITGVITKACRPSHLNFDAVVSASSIPEKDIAMMKQDWFWLNCYTYMKVNDSVDIASLEQRFNDYVTSEVDDFIDSAGVEVEGYTLYHFEPVTGVHFNTSLAYDSPSNIDDSYLWIFAIIAGFILLTASINYINLAMARSLKRAKEVGMRKVLGAYRKQLALQHISESFIVTIIAFVLALSLVELLMPQFNALIGRDLTLVGTLFTLEGITFGIILIMMIMVLAVVSGIFPAFILSTFNPVNVLKGNNFFFSIRGKQRLSAGGIRKILVTVQYVVAVGMIIATAIIYNQMNFLMDHELGYDKHHILVINSPDDTTYKNRAYDLKHALADHPGVLGVTNTHNVPGYTYGKMLYMVGDTSNKTLQTLAYYAIDHDFFNVLDIPLAEGRFFEEGMEKDSVHKYIINQAAVAYLGLDEPIGSMLDAAIYEKNSGSVIGVVEDFHFFSLHSDVEPLVFMLWPKKARYILVEFDPDQKEAVHAHVSKTWDDFNPGHYMHKTYLTDKLESLYAADQKMLSLFIYFSIFVIFISSLGLYGLSSFLIEQRIKEIGIRKVLGGSENQITLLLARDYVRLVLIAGLIASPVVYFLMNSWLDTFAFRITINGWYFVAGILLGMLFAFTTVLVRSYRVVRRSPALALKYE